MEGDLVYASKPINYGIVNLDKFQVTQLLGLRNDELLLRQKKLVPVVGITETYECSECGAKFIDEFHREMHGHTHHG